MSIGVVNQLIITGGVPPWKGFPVNSSNRSDFPAVWGPLLRAKIWCSLRSQEMHPQRNDKENPEEIIDFHPWKGTTSEA